MDNQNDPNELLNRARQLQQTGNKLSFVSTIFGSILFMAVGGAMLYFFMFVFEGIPPVAYILPVAFIILPVLAMYNSYRLSKKKIGPAAADKPFDGNDTLSTVVKQPYPRAVINDDERVTSWLGALDRLDLAGLSRTAGLTEYLNGAENTLLLVGDRIIAVAFTQEDFNQLGDNGVMNVVRQFAATDSTATEQKQNLAMYSFTKWKPFMDYLSNQNLREFLDKHYNFVLERSQITKIEPKKKFINPGVYIHINDGTVLKYNTSLKDQIDVFTSAAAAAGIPIA